MRATWHAESPARDSGTTTSRGRALRSTGASNSSSRSTVKPRGRYHDEDLDVDTDFCAMCGHDWCSMRISKEIEEFDSGKDPNFQPDRRVQRSPGFQSEARGLHKEIGNE